MQIRLLTANDAAAGLRLSTQIGWNHLLADWQRNIALSPHTCLGLFADEMVATCSVARFSSIGWVGTLLVDQAYYRQGLGTKIFEAMLKAGREAGIERFALDSSDAGRPIYARYGFELDEGIERWIGPNQALSSASPCTLVCDRDWDELLALDHSITHVDRSAQLRLLATESGARVRVFRDGSAVCGFGFTRPGRLTGSIGPVIANDPTAAAAIIDALLADRYELDGHAKVAVDLPDHGGSKDLFTVRNFTKLRRNIRMFLPGSGAPVLTGPDVYAATGLGMG